MSKYYPKSHILIVTLVSAFIGLILLVAPSEEVSAKRNAQENILSINNDLPSSSGNKESIASDNEPADTAATNESVDTAATNEPVDTAATLEQEVQPAPVIAEEKWQTLTVQEGDSLSILFQRANLTASDVHYICQASEEQSNSDLYNLHPGQQIAFTLDDKGALKKLRHEKDRLHSTTYVRTETGYEINEAIRTPVIHTRFAFATLDDSLFMAGQDAGLPQKTIMELANVFGGVIDFIYDPRKGDSFTLVFEEQFLDGEKIATGNILSAQFNNRGEIHTAIRYVDADGNTGYYSPEGISMRKAFLRSPVDFTRISSDFNLKRRHPIHKRIKAHRGIDYAAPTGTPVVSAGDGRVLSSGFSEPNGNFVVIQHGQQYTTKYLHLSKRAVKQGERVRQGQLIGNLGSTGWSTGPHLHYEFLVNGVHRNPRTILDKLPKAKAIPQSEMASFKKAVQPLYAQLQAHKEWLALNK